MAKFRFRCDSCGNETVRYVGGDSSTVSCSKCGNDAYRQIPTLNGPSDVTETVDKYTNLKRKPDQREIVERRRDEYYWTVEVPRLVNSGIYSIETMLELDWVYFDDKGHMQINNKPPHRR